MISHRIKTVIIEDEDLASRRLERMLQFFDMDIITTLKSVEESVLWLKNNESPELIFLDIQLSDGLSFEIFEQVEVSSKIIFTTAFDEYAIKAFKLNSIDYLLKPIDKEDLELAVDKLIKLNSQQQPSIDFNKISNLFQDKTYKQKFLVKVGQYLKQFVIDDITCFISIEKATYIHTTNNRDYNIDFSLEKLEITIDPKQFYRINRKYIINQNFITEIVSHSNSRLKLRIKGCDDELIVSREKVADFKNWLEG